MYEKTCIITEYMISTNMPIASMYGMEEEPTLTIQIKQIWVTIHGSYGVCLFMYLFMDVIRNSARPNDHGFEGALEIMINYTFHWGYTFQWSKNSRNWLFPSYACLYAQILATNLQTTRSNQQAPQIFETCVHVQTFWVIWWIMLLSQFQRSCSTSCFSPESRTPRVYTEREWR